MDTFYPPNYRKSDKLQKYVEEQIEKIADVVEETKKELGDTGSWGYFTTELGDYFNEI